MESAAVTAALNTLQVPLNLLTLLNLTGNLWPPRRNVQNNSCFDYIVVGAGTAGCIIANRLTENENHTVLLIEAGDDPRPDTFVALFFPLAVNSSMDWSFTSTYNNYSAKAQDGVTKLTSGKVLGGTSTINHFILARGCRRDFNGWAKIVNDSTWEYENVLGYFKKSERLVDRGIANSRFSRFHGKNGPTGMGRQPREEAVRILDSLADVGNDIVLDINGNVTTGCTQSMYTHADGVRQSTAYNYLTPIRNRTNLYVMRNSEVTKILFKGLKAVGVVVAKDGKNYVYRACKEVIVSAGVYNSPKLLMLSGIGPKKHLDSLGIKVIADLPVGNNYQDQVNTVLVHTLETSIAPPPPESVSLNKIPFPVLIILNSLNKMRKCGAYQAFTLLFAHDTPFILIACAVVFQYRPKICDEFNNMNVLHNSIFTMLGITQPESRGSVRLRSADPFEKPLIRTGYYRNKKDLDDMVKYIKDFIKIGNSTYFKKIGAKLNIPKTLGCDKYKYGTDKFWRCYALNSTASVYHAAGTCSMGSVVDGRLRVYKFENLRVVDVSVIPRMVHGSPHASVLMIGEKASDFIKEDAGKYGECSNCRVVELQNEDKGIGEVGIALQL